MPDEPSSTPPTSPMGSSGPPPVVPPVSGPPPTPPVYAYAPPAPASKKGGVITRVLTSLAVTVMLVSLVMNLYLGILVATLTGGPSEATYLDGESSERLVILPIAGTIDGKMADYVREALEDLKQDPPAALILRIDSGGGGVTASDQIYEHLVDFREATSVPLIASFGGIAASGGYYVAMPAEHIVMEQTGLTGSIGVMAIAPTVQGMLEKIGVTMHVITADGSDRKAVANNMFADWQEGDANYEVFKEILNSAYERFVAVVREGRPALSEDEVRGYANGDVYTASEAKQSGLVDEVGYLSAAIDTAASRAGITGTPRVTILRRQSGLFPLGGGASAPDLGSLESLDPQAIRTALEDAAQWKMVYRLYAE